MALKNIESYKKLIHTLQSLVKVYRDLLRVVRLEKDILIKADLNEIKNHNQSKELAFAEIRQLERERMEAVSEITSSEGLDSQTRLSELAKHLGGNECVTLTNMKSALELLLNEIKEQNNKNEMLVSSALENIAGAMGNITDELKDSSVYKQSGGMDSRPAEAGQLVSKEA